MGAGPSMDEELKDVKQITADFCASFGKNYAKFYTIGLMKKQKRIMEKEAAGNPWKLMKCPAGNPPGPVRKTGHIKKLSKHLKNWNDRFVVVRDDWIIDYYLKEEDYTKNPGKPRGSFNMSNLRVNEDVNNTLIARLEKLAEQVKLPIEDFPKPEEYPDHTFEIFHDRKGPVYMQCENETEFKEWCKMFTDARWHAPRYTKHEDKIHTKAFPIALWRTRWECDMWGWFYGGGGEESMITDCINENLAWKVLGRVDAKLTMPWAVRSKIRNSFMKTTDGIVSGAVKPAWSAAWEASQKAAPTIEEKLKDLLKPIVEAETGLKTEISGMVESGAKDTLSEKVTPHLTGLLDIVFSPLGDGMKRLMTAFDKSLEKGKEGYKTDEKRLYLVKHHSYTSEAWDAERQIWDLHEPLWAMRKVFDDVSPWRIQSKCRKRMRKVLLNALYTFENKYEELKEADGEAAWENAKAYTKDLMQVDCRLAIMKCLGYVLFGVVEEFWNLIVIKPARKLMEPLREKVPDAVKDFIDPEDLLEGVLNAILMNCCSMAFEPYSSKISFD